MGKRNGFGIIMFMIIILFALMYVWWTGEKGNVTKVNKETEKRGKQIVYKNAWIVNMQKGEILIYKDGIKRFRVQSNEVLNDMLADIVIEEDMVKNIRLKTDVIEGKVLAVDDNGVEIEGFGKVLFDDEMAVLKNYGDLEGAEAEDVLTGYALQEFIVGNGKICGIVMENEPVVENIRVIITTTDYKSKYHESIKLSADGEFCIANGGIINRYKPGEEVIIDKKTLLQGERIFVTTENDDSMIRINSVKRNYGIPFYHGTFEIVNCKEGLLLINELPLEEYLYSVLPSEMPASYGVEALKTQAVCARSYAYKQILDNSLSEYGAHVDDSSQYQVYNNMPETLSAIEAVDQTKGQILTHEDEVVEAFYFSTSCGHTTDADIWGGGEVSYVKGKLVDGSNTELTFNTEERFTEFIKDYNYASYDKEFAWYRWKIFFLLEDLSELAEKAGISERVGAVESIEVVERGAGGIVKRLRINGAGGSVIIEREYTIRKFLNPYGFEIERADATKVDDFLLLPSAYFMAEPFFEGDKLVGYHIYGGGFGHGAGMSQNAAKTMTDLGIPYNEVLDYFFEDVSISNCYSNS